MYLSLVNVPVYSKHTCTRSGRRSPALLTKLTGSVHLRGKLQVLMGGAPLVGHVGDAIRLVGSGGGVGEGVAAARRVRAVVGVVVVGLLLLVQLGSQRLNDLVLLLQLLT